MDDESDFTVLDAMREISETDRAFFNIVRFLDGSTRNHIVAAHLRNTSQAYNVLRLYSTHRPAEQERVVMNIPIGNLNSLLDPSGNFMRSFMEPVQVTPSREQIAAATENHILTTDTTCAICQEAVTCATRLRHCGHCFHSQCIGEWFTVNTRCPVCRHDIREHRDLQSNRRNNTNDNRVHSDEE